MQTACMHSSINKLLLLAGLLAPVTFAGASLTMVSATIAADGVTITIPFSGNNGFLSPSTGVTGFSVADGHGNAYTVSSAGALAHTLTLVLALPVNGATDDTVTVSLATSPTSNLTDSIGGDTPAGQSNFATTNNSAWYAPGGSLAAASRIQGGISITSGTGYIQVAAWNSSDGFLEFNACASQVNVATFAYGSHYILNQDGVQINDWGQDGAGTTWSARGAVTGLTGCHTYQIVQIESINVPFGDQEVKGVQIIGTLGARSALRKLVAETGDSLVQLAGTTPPTDSRVAHLYQSSAAFGAVDQHIGLAGYNVYGAGQIAALAPSWYSNLGGAPVLAYLRGGGNDIVSGVSTANFTTAWTTYITGVQGVSQPPQHIVCIGIPYNSAQYTLSQAQTYTALIQTVCQANSAVYVDTTLWIGGAAGRQSDGIHFSYALPTTDLTKGENVWMNRMTPITAGYLSGASYSISGPSGGMTGAASATFTVTLAGGAIFQPDSDSVARECISLNDGSAGGTFTPSIGGAGAGPLSVCASSGSSWTFTYTPSAAGAKTISFTSTAALGWKDPAAANYLSLALGGAVSASGTVVASQVIR
jgi:hypothetical protein